MAITVNYYPRMDNIAQTAYGGGQTQEGIRQQNFGLNVEQLAQRERMQNQGIAAQQQNQLFDAQVGLEQQRRGIAAQQRSQSAQIYAQQQSQLMDQLGRERLAAYGAAQNQQALQQRMAFQGNAMLQEQAFQKQMQGEQQQNRLSLLEAEQQGRINFLKEQLDFEGQQKVAEFQRRKGKLDEWLSTPGVPPAARDEAYQQLYSWASGIDLAGSIKRSQSVEEYLSQNSHILPDGRTAIRQPDGFINFEPPPKVTGNKTYSLDGVEYKAGQVIREEDGSYLYFGDDRFSVENASRSGSQQGYSQQPDRSEVLKFAKELYDDWRNSDSAKSGQQLKPSDFIREAEDFYGVNPLDRTPYLPNPSGRLGPVRAYARDDGHFYAGDLLPRVSQSGMNAEDFLRGFEEYLPRITPDSIEAIESVPPGAMYLLINSDGTQKMVVRGQEGWGQ